MIWLLIKSVLILTLPGVVEVLISIYNDTLSHSLKTNAVHEHIFREGPTITFLFSWTCYTMRASSGSWWL